MAFDFRRLKEEKKPEFHRDYGKYYPAESLESIGFSRKVCSKCGRGFWSVEDRGYCDEPTCSGGYRFIGEKLTRKPFKYKEAWDEYVKVFKQWGYVPLKRYPVVCRWYDELYFVNAGVNDFQPYVVAGDVEPPAPAVLEPQFCLRFQDMDSVGVTGRHYTGFIMVGQHTFNTRERHVYFKDEGILQMHEFLTKGLGINAKEIFYHEDVWAGGGNFGPSMEFFARGLELGNQVYMQYEVLPDGGSRELKTKVIDMGAGLERWSWFSQGAAMSYDTVFPRVMKYLREASGVKEDPEFMSRFGRYAGMLDIDEVDDIGSVWGAIARELGVGLDELREKVYEMRALYAIGDHARSLLVAIHDGALPSNVGGGYNLRTLLRRCWSLIDEFSLSVELEKVFEEHIKEFGGWYTELRETGSLFDILAVERERYLETQEKAPRRIEKAGKMTVEKMVELYDSHGIPPELVRDITGFEPPDNFYKLVEERHSRREAKKKIEELNIRDDTPITKLLFYEKPDEFQFEANILSAHGDINESEGFIILDRTLFYPESGGQESDKGYLQIGNKRYEVTYAEKKKGGIVAHKIKGFSTYWKDDTIIGSKVVGFVDKNRRIQLMQHHTATHIVNAAARKVLGPHIFQAGAHKSVKNSRLDITHYKAVSRGELTRIEGEANRMVGEAHEIEIKWLKRNEAEERYGMGIYQGGAVPGTELRIVNIKGIDVEACGGTHLKNTSEAGTIKMLSAKRIQDGVVRLEFTAGGASKKAMGKEEQIHEKSVEIFRDCLDVLEGYNPWSGELIRDFPKGGIDVKRELDETKDVLRVQSYEQIPSTISRFIDDIKGWKKELGVEGIESTAFPEEGKLLPAMARTLFATWKFYKKRVDERGGEGADEIEKRVEESFKDTDVVKRITSGLTVKALTELAKSVVEKKPGRLLVLVNKAGGRVNVVVASNSKHDAGKVCKKLCGLLGGGGGGSATLAMGGGKSDKVDEVLQEFSP